MLPLPFACNAAPLFAAFTAPARVPGQAAPTLPFCLYSSLHLPLPVRRPPAVSANCPPQLYRIFLVRVTITNLYLLLPAAPGCTALLTFCHLPDTPLPFPASPVRCMPARTMHTTSTMPTLPAAACVAAAYSTAATTWLCHTHFTGYAYHACRLPPRTYSAAWFVPYAAHALRLRAPGNQGRVLK